MTRRKSTPPEAALVAIDVAKHRNEVLIEAVRGGRRRRMTILNTRADHDNLITSLQAMQKPIVVGLEPTGNYHRVLAHRLIEAGFGVRLISSMALARTREALHNSWDKNDPKDAQVILHMLGIGATMVYQDPLAAGINDLQELSKTHEVVSKAKTQMWHRLLTHYLPLYFPEIERFVGNSRSDWFLAFLERFPTPDGITGLTKEGFVAAAWDVVGRKVSKARLLGDIYETACTSAALPVPLDSPAIAMFRLVLAEARNLVQQRNIIEAHAHELLCGHPDYLRLRQVPGIGPIHALTILAEAGDLRRFGHHRQFLKFCGLDLATHQSGQFRGQSTPVEVRQRTLAPNLLASCARSRSVSATTACAIASVGTLPKIARTRICGARQPSPSLPRWRVLFMPSSRPEQITGPSKRGRCQVEEPSLCRAVRAW